MRIPVFVDSNVWNLLCQHGVDLSVILPRERFSLWCTREVAIELQAMPDVGKDGGDKKELKVYIQNSMNQNHIQTSYVFGFSEANDPDQPPVFGGFDQGVFQSEQERDWYRRGDVQKFLVGQSRKGSRLSKNQADASLGAASMGSVVLTCDRKRGPLRVAHESGGSVLFLSEEILVWSSLATMIEKVFLDNESRV